MRYLKRRRQVEIYFILYLAALIFLLPDSKEDKQANDGSVSTLVSQMPFSLLPERSSLTAKVLIDSLGVTVVSLDSTNTIYFTGEVEDVNFEFAVIDNLKMSKIDVKSSPHLLARNFKLEEQAEKQAAVFLWNPSFEERTSKSYQVQVIATASPKNKTEAQSLKAQTQFSLNIIYLNQLQDFESTSNEFDDRLVANFLDSIRKVELIRQSMYGDFEMVAERDLLKALAYQNWTNTITAFNINLLTDLKSKPELKVSNEPANNGGEAKLDIHSNRIIVNGKTPAFGRTNVTVKATRKSDNREISISFNVMPLPIEQPSIERIMYPGKTYRIDPKLPLHEKETKAFLKEGNNIRARSNQGEIFNFTPDITDTGKIFVLERYVDNKIFGEEFRVFVNSYPNPEILDIQFVSKDEVRVRTRSFGFHNNEKNYVVDFEITGNASFRELFGRIEESDTQQYYIQFFTFNPKNSSQALNFTIKAIDRSGKKSSPKNFQ